MKWQTGCAIPKVGCPLGINDEITLPHQVKTDHWNCFSGNVKNHLAVLGQSSDRIEDNLSELISHGDSGCMKENLVRGLHRVFQDAGCHTFMLPCEMDYDILAYSAHLIKLPMFISMKMAFNEDAIKYNHIIRVSIFFLWLFRAQNIDC